MYRFHMRSECEVITCCPELDISIPSPQSHDLQVAKSKLRDMVQSAKEQKLKLTKNRMAMIKLSKELKNHEKSLNSEEEILKKEKLAILQQRRELDDLKARLSHGQAKLDQLRVSLELENDQVCQALEDLRIKATELNKQRCNMKKESPLGEKKSKSQIPLSGIQSSNEEHNQKFSQRKKINIEARQNSLEIWL